MPFALDAAQLARGAEDMTVGFETRPMVLSADQQHLMNSCHFCSCETTATSHVCPACEVLFLVWVLRVPCPRVRLDLFLVSLLWFLLGLGILLGLCSLLGSLRVRLSVSRGADVPRKLGNRS